MQTSNQNYLKLRHSAKMRKLNKKIIIRDNSTCQLCWVINGKKNILKSQFNVHHINKIRFNPELAFDENNLILLCNSCHKKVENNNIWFDEKTGKLINVKEIMLKLIYGKI